MVNYIAEGVKSLPGHWQKGNYRNDDGTKMCGLGHARAALAREQGVDFDEVNGWWSKVGADLMSKVALEQFPERGDDGHPHFAMFNDHRDTTEDEVIAVMEKAALLWEERHDDN